MTDREVQAITQFLLKFGHVGCYQITVCRPTRTPERLSREEIAKAVLEIRAVWNREGASTSRGSTRSRSWLTSILPTNTNVYRGAAGSGMRSNQ